MGLSLILSEPRENQPIRLYSVIKIRRVVLARPSTAWQKLSDSIVTLGRVGWGEFAANQIRYTFLI